MSILFLNLPFECTQLTSTVRFVKNKFEMANHRAVARLTAPNPVLEKLRDNVTGRINVDTLVADLRTLTDKIHAGYLFEDGFEEVLQIICCWVGADAEKNTTLFPNWTKFANYLRVTRVQMKNIENYFQETNGPVWWVLASYAQWDDATISEVIHALHRTEREDIIYNISDGIYKFVRHFSSIVSEEEGGILRPRTVPWVHLVLRPPPSLIKKVYKIINITMAISDTPENNSIETINNAEVPLALRVMLTFAHDGVEAAKRITKILRSHPKRIGVLILNEQMPHVFAKNLEFVDDCIEQMDAILPILTPGYMDTINRRPLTDVPLSSLGKDEECAKYIFEYLREEFTYNGIENQRVGPILPNEHKLPKLNPVLRAWYSESRIEELMQMLLLNKSKQG